MSEKAADPVVSATRAQVQYHLVPEEARQVTDRVWLYDLPAINVLVARLVKELSTVAPETPMHPDVVLRHCGGVLDVPRTSCIDTKCLPPTDGVNVTVPLSRLVVAVHVGVAAEMDRGAASAGADASTRAAAAVATSPPRRSVRRRVMCP